MINILKTGGVQFYTCVIAFAKSKTYMYIKHMHPGKGQTANQVIAA